MNLVEKYFDLSKEWRQGSTHDTTIEAYRDARDVICTNGETRDMYHTTLANLHKNYARYTIPLYSKA